MSHITTRTTHLGSTGPSAPSGHVLYGSKGSGSAAVEAALRRLRMPTRIVTASTWEPDSAQAELKRVNPLGQIPTLVLPDGTVMTESAAILIHLGLHAPDSGLLPPDASSRASVIRGLVFIAANCYACIGMIDYPERYTTARSSAARDALRNGSRQRLHALWCDFADQFPARPWLSGRRAGALDLLAAVVSRWSGARAHLERQRPAFHALLERIEAHRDFAPVFQRHWPAAG
ncbi:MAG: glutathione S-transferase family protein [Aquabacterium sp.]